MSIMQLNEPIYFNGTDLNSIEGWLTTNVINYRHPQRNISRFGLVNNDNAIVDSAYYDGSTVVIEGVITGSGRENLDAKISELKRIITPINKELGVMIAGERRIYVDCTMSNIVIQDVAGGYANISIEFYTKENVSRDTTATTLLSVANLTSSDVSYQVTVDGTAKQLPIFTLTIDAGSPTANRTITITNPATGTTISVQRDWTVSDVLVIDTDNRTVQVNDIDVTYNGNFIEYDYGENFINYTDDFTTRQIDIDVTYTKRWL